VKDEVGNAAIREDRNKEDVVAEAEIQREARRHLPIVLDEGPQRLDHGVLAVLIAERAAGRPAEHELGEAVASVAAILRVGGELAVERELAARESRGIAIDVLVLEFEAGLNAVRAGLAEQDVVELEQVEIVRVRPEAARPEFGVPGRGEAAQSVIVRDRYVRLRNAIDAEVGEQRLVVRDVERRADAREAEAQLIIRRRVQI